MRLAGLTVTAAATVWAGTACAQAWSAGSLSDPYAVQAAMGFTADLNRQPMVTGAAVAAADGAGPAFGPDLEATPRFDADAGLSPWAATRRDVWIEGDGYSDRVRLRTGGPLRRADGSPLPPHALDGAVEAVEYDITYMRGWTSMVGYTQDGLAVTFTPHAGVGVGSEGGVAEAGATVRIGPEEDALVPDGAQTFGDRARWYVYAAGSGRAVGYNFARNRDGEYDRSGMSHDSGTFLGDAQLGVAMRRGAMQSSLGLIYRELDPGVVRNATGMATDVAEGMIAFQLSIKP
ncbi:DUF2219 family protein [Rhizobium sp. CRIBSB]|nr:DUF2219 family protein [Rhizobium sp. CRIBSB]